MSTLTYWWRSPLRHALCWLCRLSQVSGAVILGSTWPSVSWVSWVPLFASQSCPSFPSSSLSHELTAVSAAPHITAWVGCWCYHSSAFWCLRGKDVETFYDLSTHGQSLRIWALSAQMHVKIPEINLMIYKEVQIGCWLFLVSSFPWRLGNLEKLWPLFWELCQTESVDNTCQIPVDYSQYFQQIVSGITWCFTWF